MNLLRRTPKPTLDRDTPHVLEVEPPQCRVDVAVFDTSRPTWESPQVLLIRCLLPVNHDGQHQWGKG